MFFHGFPIRTQIGMLALTHRPGGPWGGGAGWSTTTFANSQKIARDCMIFKNPRCSTPRKSLIFEDNTVSGDFVGVVEGRRGPPGLRKSLIFEDNTVSGVFWGSVEAQEGNESCGRRASTEGNEEGDEG